MHKALRVLVTGASIAAMGLTGVGTAFAGGIAVGDAEARVIALRKVPGTIVDVEHEHHRVEVMIRDHQGVVKEVTINPRTGHVIKVENED